MIDNKISRVLTEPTPRIFSENISGWLQLKYWGENIFKPTIGNRSLHQDNNDDGIRIVNFATSNVHTETFKSTP